MVKITDRDIDIFKLLASGPLVAERLRQELANFEIKGRVNAGDEEDGYRRAMSYGALRQRLSILKRSGLITSRIFPDRKGKGFHAVYALTGRSREILVRAGVRHEFIRTTLTNDQFRIAHELQIVDVIKKIKSEAWQSGYLYMIEDRDQLKKRIDVGKGMHFPDLHVRIEFEAGKGTGKRHFAVEIVDVAKSHLHIIDLARRNLTDHGWHSLILSPSPTQMDNLIEKLNLYLSAEVERDGSASRIGELLRFGESMFFAPIVDFLQKGLSGTLLSTLSGREVRVFPKDFRRNPGLVR